MQVDVAGVHFIGSGKSGEKFELVGVRRQLRQATARANPGLIAYSKGMAPGVFSTFSYLDDCREEGKVVRKELGYVGVDQRADEGQVFVDVGVASL